MPASWVKAPRPTRLLCPATGLPEAPADPVRNSRRSRTGPPQSRPPRCASDPWRPPPGQRFPALAAPRHRGRLCSHRVAHRAPPPGYWLWRAPRVPWAMSISTSRSTTARRSRMRSKVVKGSSRPRVSAKRKQLAPQPGQPPRPARGAQAGQEASSTPTQTSRPRSMARLTWTGISRSANHGEHPQLTGDLLVQTGIGEVDGVRPRGPPHGRSPGGVRAHTISRTGRPRAARARMESRSSWPMAGMPTSSSGTPRAARPRAMASFSSRTGDPGRLLAVAQGGVIDGDGGRGRSHGRAPAIGLDDAEATVMPARIPRYFGDLDLASGADASYATDRSERDCRLTDGPAAPGRLRAPPRAAQSASLRACP